MILSDFRHCLYHDHYCMWYINDDCSVLVDNLNFFHLLSTDRSQVPTEMINYSLVFNIFGKVQGYIYIPIPLYPQLYLISFKVCLLKKNYQELSDYIMQHLYTNLVVSDQIVITVIV